MYNLYMGCSLYVLHIIKIIGMTELAEKINKVLEKHDPDLSVIEFAEAIAELVKEEYGEHNFYKFGSALESSLYREPNDDGFAF